MRLPPSWELYDGDEKGGTNSIQYFVIGLALDARVEALALLKLLEEFGETLIGSRVTSGTDGSFELHGHYVHFTYRVSARRRINLLAGTLVSHHDQDY